MGAGEVFDNDVAEDTQSPEDKEYFDLIHAEALALCARLKARQKKAKS